MLKNKPESLADENLKLSEMFKKPLAKFKTKKGIEIEIWTPSMERLDAILEFVNRLIKEDTFLNFTGNPKTLAEEENWLKNALINIKTGRSFIIWAIHKGKIVGSSDINRGGTRDWHVGKMGLMVDRDFRQDGIGRFLLDHILKKAKKMEIKIVTLDIFGDNEVAIKLYQKAGFKEFSRLPNGLYRQKKYSDKIGMYKNLANN